jgi:hypothetical protein
MVVPISHRSRSSSRRRQRGAAVFVVLLVITLLTALGLFAVRSSSLTMRAAGYNRQLVQTHYITDYALTGAAAFADNVGEPLHQLASNTAAQDTTCSSYATLLAANRKQCCKVMSLEELDARITALEATNELLEPAADSGIAPGSLGPEPLEADMRIELTDCHDGASASVGENLATGEATQRRIRPMYTFTITGMVRPPQDTAGTWDTNAAAAAGVEMAQGRVLLPHARGGN